MKYLIVLGDGMADNDIPELGNKTPLEYADTPAMDKYSKLSEIGMVHTIPDGMAPGSDTANLSVLGYDPKEYYTGRSPLEALSIGVDMKPTDVALRCNIVTVSTDDLPYEEKTIIDHSSSEISTEDAAVLLEAVKKELENDIYKFYVGTSYRHLTIWDNGEVVELDVGHFGLICAHSTGIAFNAWDGHTKIMNWYPEYPNLTFTDKFTKNDFLNWRINSFRKLVLEISSDKEFEKIKEKLIKDEIPFRICGEIAFGSAEVAIVIFPLTKENTPKYLKFLKTYR